MCLYFCSRVLTSDEMIVARLIVYCATVLQCGVAQRLYPFCEHASAQADVEEANQDPSPLVQ